MARYSLSPEMIEALGQLKELPRSGWLDRDIPAVEVESVADHSFGVALLAWLLAPDDLDRARVVELALLHDLAESAAGDATPYDRDFLGTLDPETRRDWLNQRHIRSDAQQAAKHARETAAIETLAVTLSPDRRDQLLADWAELSVRSTPEARFVKEMDVLEIYLQSRRYLERYPDAPMESFALEARELLGDDTTR